jgi:hypothetical protein
MVYMKRGILLSRELGNETELCVTDKVRLSGYEH